MRQSRPKQRTRPVCRLTIVPPMPVVPDVPVTSRNLFLKWHISAQVLHIQVSTVDREKREHPSFICQYDHLRDFTLYQRTRGAHRERNARRQRAAQYRVRRLVSFWNDARESTLGPHFSRSAWRYPRGTKRRLRHLLLSKFRLGIHRRGGEKSASTGTRYAAAYCTQAIHRTLTLDGWPCPKKRLPTVGLATGKLNRERHLPPAISPFALFSPSAQRRARAAAARGGRSCGFSIRSASARVAVRPGWSHSMNANRRLRP